MYTLDEIDRFEKDKKYDDALIALENRVKSTPDDLHSWIRLVFLQWLLYDRYYLEEENETELSYQELENKLKSNFVVTAIKFQDHPDYLFYIGYCMSFEGYLVSDEIKKDYEVMAFDMLNKAHKLRPNDPLLELVLIDSSGRVKDMTKEMKDKRKVLIQKILSNNSESLECMSPSIKHYFKHIYKWDHIVTGY